MYEIDWNQVRQQILDMSELIDEEYDVEVCEGTVFKVYTKKYSFSGNISVSGQPVYTSGTYTNELDDLSLNDFTSDNEEFELYLEDYTIEEIEGLIQNN
jgi:hypothetical protein